MFHISPALLFIALESAVITFFVSVFNSYGSWKNVRPLLKWLWLQIPLDQLSARLLWTRFIIFIKPKICSVIWNSTDTSNFPKTSMHTSRKLFFKANYFFVNLFSNISCINDHTSADSYDDLFNFFKSPFNSCEKNIAKVWRLCAQMHPGFLLAR